MPLQAFWVRCNGILSPFVDYELVRQQLDPLTAKSRGTQVYAEVHGALGTGAFEGPMVLPVICLWVDAMNLETGRLCGDISKVVKRIFGVGAR